MQQWTLGNTRITRIEELLGPMFDPASFLPDFDPSRIEAFRDWLYPNHIDPVSGQLIASMHAWLIQTPDHNILIDTCIGNDKQRMPYRNWHLMQTNWLQNLHAAGVTPADVDYVMCTHLHVDHVGWNTQLRDGQWVPTFPNARYLFSRTEFEFWQAERQHSDGESFSSVNQQTFDDSVMPIMHLADLVEGETEVIADQLHIRPAPGHTPGSVTIDLHSQGKSALFTGDICHHPLQVYFPDWNSAYCELPTQARETRHRILAESEAAGKLLMPAHFGASFCGYVRADDSGFSFDFSHN